MEVVLYSSNQCIWFLWNIDFTSNATTSNIERMSFHLLLSATQKGIVGCFICRNGIKKKQAFKRLWKTLSCIWRAVKELGRTWCTYWGKEKRVYKHLGILATTWLLNWWHKCTCRLSLQFQYWNASLSKVIPRKSSSSRTQLAFKFRITCWSKH